MTSKELLSVFVMLFLSVSNAEYTGSTKGLKKIVLGRCFYYLNNYQHLGMLDMKVPEEKMEEFCQNVLKVFLKAFAFKDACTVTRDDYLSFFDATGKTKIKDKILFWSKHEALSLKIADNGKRAIVLADTLPGFLVTNLVWCGEVKSANPDGINFNACPVCRKDPVKDKDKKEHFEVFWGTASEMFAKRASGVIRHLVNGAVGSKAPASAHHSKTFFYLHELPNIEKKDVTSFRVIVANEPGKPVHETCGTGTIETLANDINKKIEKKPICVVNPSMVMHLMCADKPKDPECVKAIPYTEY